MNLKKLILWLLKVIPISVVAGALPLGAIGLWLAGWDGLVNGAVWGAVIGLVVGITTGALLEWGYWSDVSRRAGEARWKRWYE